MKEYIPDYVDEDWLRGNAQSMPSHPKDKNYEARMEWRREQMERKKQAEQYITKDQVKGWLIAIAIILGIIFILYKASQQPDAYNSAPDCAETGQC